MGFINGTKLPYKIEEKIRQDEEQRKKGKKQVWINIAINILCLLFGALLDNIVNIYHWIIKVLT